MKASLPSADAAMALLSGARGATTSFVVSTLLRSLLLLPGMLLVGVEPKKAITGSLVGSAAISTFILLYVNASGGKSPLSARLKRQRARR